MFESSLNLYTCMQVSVMTHALANILASLYSKGFGTSAKDHDDVSVPDGSQLASGTGMGEGSGLKDVSDQITDEDQLLGTSEKVLDCSFARVAFP